MSGAATMPMINHTVLPRHANPSRRLVAGRPAPSLARHRDCFPTGWDCIQRTTGPVHVSTARSTQVRRGSSVARTLQRPRRRYRSTLNRGVIAMLTTPFNKRGLKLFAASLTVALATAAGAPALASSHREAPFIASMPQVDATDFYMFRSYEPGRDGFVTLIADYLPLQDPYGGPNYFQLDPDARYEIHVDNDGDAVADVTFRFQFKNELQDVQLAIGPQGAQKQVSIPLINFAPIGAGDIAGLNVQEFYTLDVIRKQGKKVISLPVLNADTQEMEFRKPVDNIGNKSIPDYAAYAATHVYDIALPGSDVPGRVFVGQRKDPFVVNLGETFDLVNLDPLGDPAGNLDDLADANVTSLVLEIPISFLVAENPVIGGWTTASLPKTRVLVKQPTFEEPNKEKGKY